MLRCLSSLLTPSVPLRDFTRNLTAKKFKHQGWRKAPQGGPKYFPLHPDEKDPEITPVKLFRVERVKTIRHTTKLQREALKSFGLDAKGKTVSIAKNTANENCILWKIKHLVRITPITFPYGEPTEEDLNHTVLKENGQCIVSKKLSVDEERIKLWEDMECDPGRMDGMTISKNCLYKWNHAWGGGI